MGKIKWDTREYKAIHAWLTRNHPLKGRCEHCNRTDKHRYEHALIKGLEHARDNTRYKELCQSCHSKYDGNDHAKGNKYWLGRKHSQQSKNKISQALKGKIKSEEHKKNLSLAISGKKHHLYGKTLPVTWRKKIGESNKGKVMTEEAKRKVGDANRGRRRTDEVRNKMSKSLKGKGGKVVIDTISGQIYTCIKYAATAKELKAGTLSSYLNPNNGRKNPTTLMYLEDYEKQIKDNP